MNSQTVQIEDQNRDVIASAQDVEDEGRYSGTVDLACMPANLRQVFEEFEEIVNDQVFSLLDELEEKIAALALQVVFPGGHGAPCEDLQIYPSTRRISYRLVRSPVDGQLKGSSRSAASAVDTRAAESEGHVPK